jgi:hypothetical protein
MVSRKDRKDESVSVVCCNPDLTISADEQADLLDLKFLESKVIDNVIRLISTYNQGGLCPSQIVNEVCSHIGSIKSSRPQHPNAQRFTSGPGNQAVRSILKGYMR